MQNTTHINLVNHTHMSMSQINQQINQSTEQSKERSRDKYPGTELQSKLSSSVQCCQV